MGEIDLLLKLFDTLKDSMKDQQTVHNALLTNQNDLGNYLKTLPIEEIKLMLKEHTKESSDEIESCTETVESKSDTILNEIKIIKDKIKTMIIIVMVTFSLFGMSLLIAKIVDNHDKNEIKDLKEQIELLHRDDKTEK